MTTSGEISWPSVGIFPWPPTVVTALLAVIEVAHDLPDSWVHQEAIAGVAGGDE
jgi:hypothetical protein